MTPDNKQESNAIQALKHGDVDGLEALVLLYQLQSVRAAYGIVGNLPVAEDAVADAFLLVYERIAQYDEKRPFAPWFYRIVVNCALKAVRGQGRISQVTRAEEDWVEQRAINTPGPEQTAEYHELRDLLMSLVYELPAQQRAAVVLRYYLDMDEATIAQTLGCPLGTVKWRLHAAKGKLRERLLPQVHTLLSDYEG